MDNSGDYISRDDGKVAAWEILEGMGYSITHNDRLAEEVDAVFDEIPAADVRPVERSEWKIYHKTNIAMCKCCSYQYMMGAPWHEYPPRFCPNCGADMRPEPPKEE